MGLPVSNATLTRVQGGGGSEDYDTGPTGGADKWAGATGVYVNDRTNRVTSAERSSVIVSRTVVVAAELRVDWQVGDTLSFTWRRIAEQGSVRAIEISAVPGLPGTVRLTLEDR
jgi:hypothetical protein